MLKAAFPLLKSSPSSTRWLARQQSDPFVRTRTHRSRSAAKLSSILTKHKSLIPHNGTVVDLGAAPGGWSQVAREAMGRGGSVYAVDLLPIAPIEGVTIFQGDFLTSTVQAQLRLALDGKQVDCVLSDMMANMSGQRTRDVQNSLDLCEAALAFASRMLRTDGQGSLVYVNTSLHHLLTTSVKYFQHPWLDEYQRDRLEPAFRTVRIEKPKESRSGQLTAPAWLTSSADVRLFRVKRGLLCLLGIQRCMNARR
jgi:23S rRNA (uridine2552-2'-O)-methyltransferase